MNVVAIGAHPDDIEIGAGGALALHKERGWDVHMLVVTRGGELSDPDEREIEARCASERLGADSIEFLDFEDTQVPYEHDLISQIETKVDEVDADRAYIHTTEDTHQDHRRAANASITGTRHVDAVLAFESPSTRSSFTPQYYVPLSKDLVKQKIEAIRDHKTQRQKKYLEAEAMEGLARFRGRQANTTYAEAFQVIRIKERASV